MNYYLYLMKLTEARQQFISNWGAFGTHWGINRTMAQIHALLLVSPDPLTQDDIMEELNISRGNVNMNIRELINWGLVERVLLPGERKEYFSAEKDIWKVVKQIVKERKKRELEPMLGLLDKLEDVEGDKRDKNVKAFIDTVSNIKKLGRQADKTLDVMIKAEENWFVNNLVKFFK
ncbi:MAG TPA: MarR family transcriptional regulator [Chitinophagaceae bacterium]|nr:MarR family transcriptional regulator [Chitinophagaceae bacterium]